MKISHKLCVRMDGTQNLLLWWFTTKNEHGNDKIAWAYILRINTSEKQTIQIHRSQGTVVVCYKMWGHKIPLSKWIWTQCTCWCESTSFLILSHCGTWSSVCMLHETIKKTVLKNVNRRLAPCLKCMELAQWKMDGK